VILLHRLTQDELNNLKNVNNEKLLNMLERWSDRIKIVEAKHTSGVPEKTPETNPDVRKLYDDYDDIRTEVEKRLKRKGINVLNLNTLLNITGQISLYSAGKRGIPGIPEPTTTEAEIEQVKDDFNNVRGSIDFNLGN
jgi:hypothetical protein